MKPVNLGDGLLRLSPGWYWTTIGKDAGGFASEQLDTLVAMGAIRVAKTQAALWTEDEPGQWYLFEAIRETQFQTYPDTWGPFEAPKGEETIPRDVGQEWEPPKGVLDNIAEGAADAVDPRKSVLPWFIGGAIVLGAIVIAGSLRDRRR